MVISWTGSGVLAPSPYIDWLYVPSRGGPLGGDVTAELVAEYVRKGIIRPSMPIAFITRVVRYLADETPNTGESPSSQPPYNS